MTPIDFEKLNPDLAARIDAVCDRFETSWKERGDQNRTPDLESFLEGWQGEERTVLAGELGLIDRACRQKYGFSTQNGDTRPQLGGDALSPKSPLSSGTSSPVPVESENGPFWPKIQGLLIEKVLGSGGMGIVYLARQLGLERLVAVKLLRDSEFATNAQKERFLQEARAVARLKHPHLVQIHELGEYTTGIGTQYPYLVLEYIAGGSLADHLRGTPQPPVETARLLKPIAEAVHYAHEQGIIHRDLKPANILIHFPRDLDKGTASSLSLGVPKITDFGLAKFMEASKSASTNPGQNTSLRTPLAQQSKRLTVTHDILGTPCYMAPEQGQAGGIGPAVDIYSLGAILYEALTGRPPYLGSTPVETMMLARTGDFVGVRQLQPGIPRDLETICHKCLSREPHRRYGSAGELALELDRFLQGMPIKARPVGWVEKAWRTCRTHPVVSGLVLTVAALVIAFQAALFGLYRQAMSEKSRADRNLAKAREVVDSYLTGVEKDPRLMNADLAGLRKELLEAAIPFFGDLAAESGGDLELESQRAKASIRLTHLFSELNQRQQGRVQAAEAVKLCQSLLDAHPKQKEFSKILAKAILAQGNIETVDRNDDLALSYYAQARQVIEASTLSPAEDHEVAEFYALLFSSQGIIFLNQGKLKESIENFDRCIDVVDKNEKFKDIKKLAKLKALSHMAKSKCIASQGDLKGALSETSKSFELYQDLAKKYPEDLDIQQDLIHPMYNYSWYLHRMGNLDEAEPRARQIIATVDEMAAKFPNLARARYYQAGMRQHLSEVLFAGGSRNEAVSVLEMAMMIQDRLCGLFPENLEYRKQSIASYESLGRICHAEGRWTEAISSYQKAMDGHAALQAKYPGDRSYLNSQILICKNLVAVRQAAGQKEEAEKSQKVMIGLLESRRDLFPDFPDNSILLAEAHLLHAELKANQEKWDGALADFQVAEEHFETILAKEDNNRRIKAKVPLALLGQARSLMALKRFESAIPALDRLIPMANPSRPRFKTMKARCLVESGHVKEGVVTLDEVSKLPKVPPQVWYDMAAVAAMAHGKSTPGSNQEPRVQLALQLLTRAQTEGFFKDSTQFQKLRDDPDFQSLKDVSAYRVWCDRLFASPAPMPVTPARVIRKP